MQAISGFQDLARILLTGLQSTEKTDPVKPLMFNRSKHYAEIHSVAVYPRVILGWICN